jgi:ATP-dependent helicase/nuclease subunit B
MSGAARRRVFTVPPGAALADALALGVEAECGGDALRFSEVAILLPHRRAVRAVADAFLRRSGGKPAILPALKPIGDVDEDDAALLGDDLAAAVDDPGLPPAIGGPRRLMLLTRLIAARDPALGAGQALRLAQSLARLIDQAHTERRSFDGLKDLAPREFARHWEETLQFLAIVTEAWPKLLQEEGAMDPAERRDKALGLLAQRWRKHPPAGPVLIAGSTGSVPATADLMDAVSALERGAVILPGFDREAVARDGEAILGDPTHPQHGMAVLVKRLGLEPAQIADWPKGIEAPRPRRHALLSAALRPASATDGWRELKPFADEDVAKVWRVDCPGPREEAAAIALMLRETLEQKGSTAALVTPDRGLARRVAVELKRWGVEIDDSAGLPLSETPPAVFMRLVARMLVEEAAPAALLACFKHPLCAGGIDRDRFRALTRRLEIMALRGPRPAPGFAGIQAALRNAAPPDQAVMDWFAAVTEKLRPLAELLRPGRAAQPLEKILAQHWQAASFLATDADGTPHLRVGEAGEALARRLDEIDQAADALGAVEPADYLAVFAELLAGAVVRPRRGQHPRLAIWGLLEARLQQADRLILGGLNEGVWPPAPPDDPWMSRPMRAAFGLPPPERRIGLSAHDFAQGFLAGETILTRAARIDGTPMVPSRWLMRLDAVLRAGGRERGLPAGHWLAWQDALDEPETIEAAPRPAPRPPIAARPRRLSVTQVETLMRDPYAIYARHILRLKKLPEIDEQPGAAERGTVIHRALEAFVRAYPKALPEDALERLLALGREQFRPFAARPGVAAFWWPRFERAARWFVETERARRPFLSECRGEASGGIEFAAPGGKFRLTAKADRVDRFKAGGLAVIDYKTGRAPTQAEIETGLAPQMPLEAVIAAEGGFAGVAAAGVAALEVWVLSGGAQPGEVRPVRGDPAALAASAFEGLKRLVAAFDKPETPYVAMPGADAERVFSDYAHLARVKEWSVAEDAE